MDQNNSTQESINRFNFRRSAKRAYPIILLVVGFLQHYVFWFLYYIVELQVLACVSAIAGTIMQITGLIRLYMNSKSAEAAKWLISIMVGLILLWAWLFLYYGSLLIQHLQF